MIENASKLGLRVFILRNDTKKIEEYCAEGKISAAWEVVEERASIMEFEGGMDRKTAERSAGIRQHENPTTL
jgi:hypothetical protein